MKAINCFALTAAVSLPVCAQFGRSNDWTTTGFDAQRSFWVRTDAKISPASLAKPGFQLLGKQKVEHAPRQLNSVTAPVLLDFMIGYKGFRSLAFAGTASNKVVVFDTDLNRLEWQVSLPGAATGAGTLECPGGMTSALTRATPLSIAPPPAAGGGGFGRSTPAQSAVGEPEQGAVTLARVNPAPAGPKPGGAKPAGGGGAFGPPPAPPQARPGGPGGFGGPSSVLALAADGTIHALNVQNGKEFYPPQKFLAAGANASGFILSDAFAYAATSNRCGGVADGVWAYNFESKQVLNWTSKTPLAGNGGPAFAPNGTVFAANQGGEMVALDSATLAERGKYSSGGAAFTTSPVVFEHKGKVMVAAAAKGGRVHVVDSGSLSTAAAVSPASSPDETYQAGALATWQDSTGTRWILAPTATSVVAWKLSDRGGSLTFETGWTSRALVSPLTPAIVNGVVFVVSSGQYRGAGAKTAEQIVKRSTAAVLYALDGTSGKELWNSGKSITSFVPASGGLSAGGFKLYLGTYDGTLYTFGFPIEH